MIPAAASTDENLDQRLEILFAERVVDQEFQAERHDDVEQRLDHDAEADECQDLLVVLQERFDEAIDRRQRTGSFLRGKDDELLIFLVIVELDLVSLAFIIVIIGRRRGLVAGTGACDFGASQELFAGFRRERVARDSFDPIIRRWRLGAMKPTDAARPA